jgi:pimeloyl-ACP methyl ester carboxylesterase
METVTSSDGTNIAFKRSGRGPPLVLVHGTTADHTRWNGILPELERHFTVFAMDRRGRGESGDSKTYMMDMEYKDVAAVVRAAGSDVNLLGHSFGALCAMEAALRVDNLRRVVLYEPPFPVGGKPLYATELAERLKAIFATGDRELLLTTFFKEVVGIPEEQVATLRADSSWQARIASAHTALREMANDDYKFDAERFKNLDIPVLLLVGENSPAILTEPTGEIAAALPKSRIVLLEGQGHVAMTMAPEIFLKAVTDFLLS